MLQKMRDQTQSTAFKVLVGIIVFVLAVFGFGAFNLFVGGDPEVASVNGEGITQGELALATERERRRLASRMGGEFDPSMIDPVRLQGAVLDQLIARELLAQAAGDLGIGVGQSRVEQVVVRNPNFQTAGQFNQDIYRQAVQAMGYTPQAFLDDTAELMALEQLQTAVTDTAFLSRRELNLHAALLGQRRDVAYLPFDADRYRDQVEVTDEEVRTRYEENQRAYMTEERLDAAYVRLSVEQLAGDPAIDVSEEEIRSAYETERAAAPPEEERRSRHILLETGDGRTAEEAVAALQDIRERVAGGESFADIAAEVSEDSGSAGDGGDLGFAGRGIFDPAFEDALFALEAPGDVSEPVETEFGYHLIQLEAVRENDYPDFETMRQEVEQRLRRAQAELLFEERLRELDNLAFEHPNGLQTIVDQLGLERVVVADVTREQGEGPFGIPRVRDALFAEDVLDKGFNSAAIDTGDGSAVVVRVDERHLPEQIPFETVAEEIRAEMERERAGERAREAQAEALARIRAGENVSEVAADVGGNWQTFQSVRRNAAEVPRAVLGTAFDLPRPGSSGKSVGEAALPRGGTAIVIVTSVTDGDVQSLTDSEVAGMRDFLANRVSRLEFASLFETLRRDASVQRPQ